MGYAGSFVLYNHAITMVRAAPAAVIINLIPAVGFVSAVVLVGRAAHRLGPRRALLICASVGVFTVLEAKSPDLMDAEVEPTGHVERSSRHPPAGHPVRADQALGLTASSWPSNPVGLIRV